MKIVLFQPQIPQNAGNIARTCAATGTSLVLVRPFGFSTNSRQLKRAGLDYWSDVAIEEIEDLTTYLENEEEPFYFFSSKAKQPYINGAYTSQSTLIFGSETAGLPEIFWQKWPEKFLKIPMKETARCLNLSNSVAIALYEALRQNGFSSLENR